LLKSAIAIWENVYWMDHSPEGDTDGKAFDCREIQDSIIHNTKNPPFVISPEQTVPRAEPAENIHHSPPCVVAVSLIICACCPAFHRLYQSCVSWFIFLAVRLFSC
jgi:hypothetical protein